MQRFLTRALILGSLLALPACGIPGAVAYGVKAAQGSTGGTGDGAAPALQPAPAPADADPAPPPTPVRRESIQVEQLPPAR